MPSTKTKPQSRTKGKRKVAGPAQLPDVLTLSEAAAYLRVSEEAVVRLVGPDGLPGKLIDDEWRFSKSAIQEWLATPPKPSSREAVSSLAGAWKDDPEIDKMLEEIYRKRGRAMTEADE
jgi:excisionase family DNA binding protein